MTRLGVVAALAVVPAPPAAAQSASATAARPEPAVEAEHDRARLTFSGQVNAALLYAHQGDRDQVFVIDNDASGSRFGMLAKTDFGDWATGVDVVVSAEVNSSDEVDFGEGFDAVDDNSVLGDFRQAHWFVEHPGFGRLSIGQGDTAAEDTAHADLSGTDFAGSGSDVDDIAGGLVLSAGDGTELAELDNFFDMQDGVRALRVLYETPELAGGLSFKASLDDGSIAGDRLQPAVGVGFAGGVEVAAEASWRREHAGEGGDTFIVGSASILLPSGWNVTVADPAGTSTGPKKRRRRSLRRWDTSPNGSRSARHASRSTSTGATTRRTSRILTEICRRRPPTGCSPLKVRRAQRRVLRRRSPLSARRSVGERRREVGRRLDRRPGRRARSLLTPAGVPVDRGPLRRPAPPPQSSTGRPVLALSCAASPIATAFAPSASVTATRPCPRTTSAKPTCW